MSTCYQDRLIGSQVIVNSSWTWSMFPRDMLKMPWGSINFGNLST
jgi:hypothetical protein